MNIKTTDWGIAYSYEDTIEFNKKLLENPKLLTKVLQHEKKHIESGNNNIDLKVDLDDVLKPSKEMTMFCIKHPYIALQSLMPFWYHKKTFNINYILVVIYSNFLLMGLLIYYLIKAVI